MTARRYTQAQITQIFADAEASAEECRISSNLWDGYVLAYVAATLGVKIARHEARDAAVTQ